MLVKELFKDDASIEIHQETNNKLTVSSDYFTVDMLKFKPKELIPLSARKVTDYKQNPAALNSGLPAAERRTVADLDKPAVYRSNQAHIDNEAIANILVYLRNKYNDKVGIAEHKASRGSAVYTFIL